MKKFLIFSLLVIVLTSSALIIYINFYKIIWIYASEFLHYSISFGLALVVYLLVVRKRLAFFENFFHEMTHVLFSLLFLEKVNHFFASSTHGEIQTSGSFPNVISILSPYFFPVVTFLLIAIWSIFDIHQLRVIVIVSYGSFIAIMIKQIKQAKQEVLSFSWYGVLFIIIMNFWVSLFIFSWASGNSELVFKTLISQLYEIKTF